MERVRGERTPLDHHVTDLTPFLTLNPCAESGQVRTALCVRGDIPWTVQRERVDEGIFRGTGQRERVDEGM
eukprot:8078329-Pyramimonas_sp.AAC.1